MFQTESFCYIAAREMREGGRREGDRVKEVTDICM